MVPVFRKGWLENRTTLIISSPMGMRNGRMHYGIDVVLPVGVAIAAPVSGQIVQTAIQKNSAGLYLKLRFDAGDSVSYDIFMAHLNRVVVSKGQDVSEGDVIAYSGGHPNDTPRCGRTTGPHLHLEVRMGGRAINPLPFLAERCLLKGRVIHTGRDVAVTPKSIDDSVSNYVNVDVTDDCDVNAIEQDTVTATSKPGAVKDRLAPGIWQITKLLMDSSVSHRQVFDSSIAMQTGPLGNFFNKVCQQPLVELSGDTFGDQYYFMVRKPPFDKESIDRMRELTLSRIEEQEIISTNIEWTSSGIYSWYQLIPYAEYCGLDQTTLYMPAIFFPEYAAIWGSKDLTIQSQYVNFYMSGYWNQSADEQKKKNGENVIKNAVRDLKYLVESNAYIPFTRSGTITLNGDRRIKRGTLIIMPNSEQFYVDSVSNSISFSSGSVERTTTLKVSRGMFQDYVDGKEVNGDLISYFNIIDFGDDFDVDSITVESWKKMLSTWRVNLNVFAYFLKRSQILSTYIDNAK